MVLASIRKSLNLPEDEPLLNLVVDEHYLAAYAEYHQLASLEAAADDLSRRLSRVFGLEDAAWTGVSYEDVAEQEKTPSQTGLSA